MTDIERIGQFLADHGHDMGNVGLRTPGDVVVEMCLVMIECIDRIESRCRPTVTTMALE